MSTPNTFDQYANEYDATVQAAINASGESVAFFAELKAKLARELAPADTSRVLDFGCGIGNASRALAVEFPRAKVVGVDPSRESLDAARGKSSRDIDFVQQSDDRVPFDDGHFDLAVAACVFHHIPTAEQKGWLDELRRVLRPGGRLVLFEHNPLNPLTRRVVNAVPFDKGVALLRRREAVSLVRASGLEIRDSKFYFFFPRALAPLRVLERFMGWVPFGGQYLVVGER